MAEFEEITLGAREKGQKSSLFVFAVVFLVYFALYRGTAALSLGAAVLQEPFELLLGRLGTHLLYALLPAVSALLFFHLLHRATTRRWIASVAALLLVLNPLAWSYPFLSLAWFGLLLVCALFLVLEARPMRPLLAGLLAGALVAVLTEAAAFLPLLLLWVALRGAEERDRHERSRGAAFRSTLLFAGAALFALLPVLYVRELAPNLLQVPPDAALAQQSGSLLFPHAAFGIPFSTSWLLNYPFHDAIVRTPHFPFPAFLLLPFVLFHAFGVLLAGVVLVGMPPAMQAQRRLSWLMCAWVVLLYLLWAFREDVTEERVALLLWMLPAWIYFMAFGIWQLCTVGAVRRNVLVLVAFLLFAVVLLRFSRYVEFPADPRWEQKHPAAAQGAGAGLRDDRRLTDDFFRTPETDDERLRRKQDLTSICLLPCTYLPVQWDAVELEERLVRELER
jgi:hypothetical protein